MQKLLVTAALLIFTLTSCEINNYDPKNIEDRDYAMQNFTGIDVSDAIEVEVISSSKFKVTATGDHHDLDYLSLKVKNKQLLAYCTRNRWFSTRKIKLFIEMPEIKSINLSGASEGNIADFINTKSLAIELSGASNLLIDIPADEIIGEISGASELKLMKSIDKQNLDLSGASTLNAFDSNSKTSNLDLSGASEANVTVSDFLKVLASGASKVRYKGSPNIEQTVSGSSKVVKY